MSTTVVLALDGTIKDQRAIAAAAAIGRLTGARLRLVRVAAADARAAAERSLTAAARSIRATHAGDVVVELLGGHDVAAELVRDATAMDALLLAMATRAQGKLQREVRGSVADEVMRRCRSPVLLVPPGASYLAGKEIRYTRVLVPLDGSALGARGLDFVLRLPSAVRLEYALLEVVPRERDRAAAEERLAATAQRVRALGAHAVDYDVAVTSHPARAIVAAVREALIDLIAMSSRGHGGLQRALLGSVAEGVVRASEVPVLLLTPASLDGDHPMP